MRRYLRCSVDRARTIWRFTVWGAVLVSAACASAQEVEHAVNAGLGFGPIYRPESWLPVRVEVLNRSTQAVAGAIELPIRDDWSSVILQSPLLMPPQSRRVVDLYARFAEPAAAASPQEVGQTPPIGVVSWRTEGGAQLARGNIVAEMAGLRDRVSVVPPRLVLALGGDNGRLSYNVAEFASQLAAVAPLVVRSTGLDHVPRSVHGYDACAGVILSGIDPDELDLPQRAALMEFIGRGGALVLPAPAASSGLSDSWLAPLLPVQLAGAREVDSIAIPTDPASSLRFREAVTISEAFPRDGTIVRSDELFVHAAFLRHGLGRIIFTSFPINALEASDPQTSLLWRELWPNNAERGALEGEPLANEARKLLPSMIGLPTLRWRWAAAVCAMYLLIVLTLQFALRGPRRVLAFIVSLGLVVLITAALLAEARLRRGQLRLTGGRISLLNFSPGGPTRQADVVAFIGKDAPQLALEAIDAGTSLWPVQASEGSPPALRTLPFSAPHASARRARIDRIWQAEGAAAGRLALEAACRFGPDGLMVQANSSQGASLRSGLLIWDGIEVFRLPDLPGGTSALTVGPHNRNTAGDFSNASVFTSQADKLHAAILHGLFGPLHTSGAGEGGPPLLVGWLDETGAPALLHTSGIELDQWKCAVLAAATLRIDASSPGPVRIDPGFSRLLLRQARGLPYDVSKQRWSRTSEQGAWVFGVAPPREAGPLRIKRVVVDLDLDAPDHRIMLRRGQCADGTTPAAPVQSGPALGEWRRTLARDTISFECDAADVDADGVLWLGLSVEPADPGSTDLPGFWELKKLDFTLHCERII